MNKSDSYDSKLSQARGLASQLGMFAEENDIPKDLWDSLEAKIYHPFTSHRCRKESSIMMKNRNEYYKGKKDETTTFSRGSNSPNF